MTMGEPLPAGEGSSDSSCPATKWEPCGFQCGKNGRLVEIIGALAFVARQMKAFDSVDADAAGVAAGQIPFDSRAS